ncbi:uncharacterized protein N0V96_007470 [Colletotrichum fioriniae]|uniref:uncharacterized protein n=1 Tax=Colletotrichum fioriniae TaxID=710243 RepID=UPI0032D9DB18|nr:hypothetical protein N0V96_007470 [Colletotrichum fioriniae]
MQEWTREDKAKVEAQLTEMAGGMFRWVQCQLDSLEKCIDSSQVDETLASLPSDLPSTYERILVNLDIKSAVRVRDVLVALAFARRPLQVGEVMDIISISITNFPRANKHGNTVYLNQLLSLCSSMVSISSGGGEKKKQEMRLAHASVKDYLVSEHLRNGPASAFYTTPGQGHLLMAAKCVACLLDQNDVSHFGPHTLGEVPFLLYSALNWVHHARDANLEPDRGSLDDLIFALFHRDGDAYINWHRVTGRHGPATPVEGYAWDIHIRDGSRLIDGGRPCPKERLLNGHQLDRPLHHALQWNLWRVVQRLLDAGHDPNGYSKGNRAPLHYGVLQRALESMDLILNRGGNIDIRDWIGDTPAMFCAYKAQDPVTMEWLMDRGASLFPVSRRSGSLLQCAAMEGDPEVLEVILRKKPPNVSPDIGVDHNYNEIADLATPLQCAAYAGNLACIELLLKYGAEINLAKAKVGTPLHAAAASGNLKALQLLLRDRYCRDILDAARLGMTSRVKAYLDSATDRKAELGKKHDLHMRTPLLWAAAEGHIETVKYLATEGASLDQWGRGFDTPLEIGCLAGRLDMVNGNKELIEFLKTLEEDRTATFEFEGQTYEHDGNKGYKRKQ